MSTRYIEQKEKLGEAHSAHFCKIYMLTIIHPIGDWIHRDAALENIFLATEDHSGHVSTVTPSPYADSGDVEILVRFQKLSQHSELILYLDAAYLPEDILLSLTTGAAYVQSHIDHVVVTRHVRSPIHLELVGDGLAAGTAVHLDEHGKRRVPELFPPRRRQ